MRETLQASHKLAILVGTSIAVLLFAVAILVIAIAAGVRNQDKVNRQVCHGFNHLNAVITATLKRSQANLPKLVYFQEHPDELARQEQQIKAQLADFRQHKC